MIGYMQAIVCHLYTHTGSTNVIVAYLLWHSSKIWKIKIVLLFPVNSETLFKGFRDAKYGKCCD
jgi:hypothetical protein